MLKIKNLRTEYAVEPIGIDCTNPRFSYELVSESAGIVQMSYRIAVATSPDKLDSPDMWDSRIVEGCKNFNILYDGKPLKSCTEYFWRVTVECEDDITAVSDIACFETAFLSEDEWNDAKWIGKTEQVRGDDEPNPIFRKEFTVPKNLRRARAYVSGLGFYELSVNGEKCDNSFLNPGQTDYEQSVLYVTHDITDLLSEGENAYGISLGRGRFNMATVNAWGWECPPWRAECRYIMKIMLEDASGNITWINSDETVKASTGPLLYDCLYRGETYDARLEKNGFDTVGYDESDWENAVAVKAPLGKLHTMPYEPIRPIRSVEPVAMWRNERGGTVYDFGIMTAGAAVFFFNEKADTEISIRFTEKVDDKGQTVLEYEAVSAHLQLDKYICKGEDDIYMPTFTYHGFQFIEITGASDLDMNSIKAVVMHTDVETTGYFDCSNTLLNRIHGNCTNAMLNNYHGIITDTPVYEKNGWTGDAQLTAQAAMYNFDMVKFYEKWVRDIAESQIETGEICVICPTANWGYEFVHTQHWDAVGGPVPAWDAALMLIPKWVKEFYGADKLIRENYDVFVKYMDYIAKFAEGNVIRRGLGDWLAPSNDTASCSFPPDSPEIVATTYYYLFAKAMTEYAQLLDKEGDARKYEKLAEDIKKAFNAAFWNVHEKCFTTRYPHFRQTNNVFPLAAGIVSDDKYDYLLARTVYEIHESANDHLDVGIVGTKYIFHLLAQTGNIELAYKIATKTTYPSFGYMLENGATALWESWELSTRSLNHHMYGSIDDLFYQYICGIKPTSDGFKSFTIKPMIPAELKHAKAGIQTVSGRISVRWIKNVGKLTMTCQVPAGSDALIYVPLICPNDYASFDFDVPALELEGCEDGYAVFTAKSGVFTFVVEGKNMITATAL